MEQNNEPLKQAKDELEAVCQKYDIALIPVMIHRGNETYSTIDLVPRSLLQARQSVTEQAPA